MKHRSVFFRCVYMWVGGVCWGCFLKMCVYGVGFISLDVCICGWVVLVGAVFFRCVYMWVGGIGWGCFL